MKHNTMQDTISDKDDHPSDKEISTAHKLYRDLFDSKDSLDIFLLHPPVMFDPPSNSKQECSSGCSSKHKYKPGMAVASSPRPQEPPQKQKKTVRGWQENEDQFIHLLVIDNISKPNFFYTI